MNELQDGSLLAEVALSGSAACFEELVRRHGAMVFNVCRRLLGDTPDAEDAAQAVFLVLWTKAAKLRGRASVAGWLHHVARNVCRNARRARDVRSKREREAIELGRTSRSDDDLWTEIRDILDDEMDQLPEKYRLPLILFHLEGRSLEEIAALLGAKPSTVGTWLSRGREMLRTRLARRGIGAGVASLAVTLTANAGTAAMPASFVAEISRAASIFAAGHVAAAGPLSIDSAALAKGALQMLSLAKAKSALLAVCAAVIVTVSAIGLTGFAFGTTEQEQADIERLQGTWTVVAVERGGQPQPEEQFKSTNSRFIFEGNRLRKLQTAPDGTQIGEEVTYTVNPSASPKAIDASQGKTVYGIYEFTDDGRLKICIDRNGRDRPTEFKTKPNSREIMHVLERQQDGNAEGEE